MSSNVSAFLVSTVIGTVSKSSPAMVADKKNPSGPQKQYGFNVSAKVGHVLAAFDSDTDSVELSGEVSMPTTLSSDVDIAPGQYKLTVTAVPFRASAGLRIKILKAERLPEKKV